MKAANQISVADLGRRMIGKVVISEKMIELNELEIGRSCFHHITNGIYEITMLCRNSDGFRCHRSAGLFADLDSIPQWVYDNR
jgi:hypothetical protein